MTNAFPILGKDPLKLQDWSLAQAIGRSVESVRLYRTGRQPIPAEVRARVLQWRAERALQQITEGLEELGRIKGEARAHDIVLADGFQRFLSLGRALHALGALGSTESRDGDTPRDDAAEASR